MPDKKGKTSLFIKDEASYSPTSGTLSDYLGVGAKYSSDSVGTVEGMLASSTAFSYINCWSNAQPTV